MVLLIRAFMSASVAIGLDVQLLRRRAQDRTADVLSLIESPQVVGCDMVSDDGGLCAFAEHFGKRQEQRQHRDQQRDLLVGMRCVLGMPGVFRVFMRTSHRALRARTARRCYEISTACKRRRAASTTLLLRARMGVGINVEQTLGADRGIDLRGRERGVAEQFLDRAQVAAARQQVRGE
jgi:hypothetical protein